MDELYSKWDMEDNISPRLVQRFIRFAQHLGPKAFSPQTSVILYSGPALDVQLGTQIWPINSNELRSSQHKILLDASRINETLLGNMLFKENGKTIYDVLRNLYSDKGTPYANEINREFSRMFIRATKGRVYTSVCGAARDRIFYESELPELVTNTTVTHVNGMDADYVREQYERSAERAFRYVCLTEQSLMLGVAQNQGTFDGFMDYAERRALYIADKHRLQIVTGGLPSPKTLLLMLPDVRPLFAQEKLAQRTDRIAAGKFQPWRPERLTGTPAAAAKL